MDKLGFRFASIEDIPTILNFIKELAKYENLEHEVVATEQLLEKWLFVENKAEVLFAIVDDKPIGFALFFNNFSTFLGKCGLYLEDLFVYPEYRGRGFGKEIIIMLTKIAKSRDLGRVEWSCLKWNKPSIDFYESLGAKQMEEWTTFRLDDLIDTLSK